MKKVISLFSQIKELSVILFLVILFVLVGTINPDFLQFDNIMITLRGSVMYIALAIGMTFVILTGNIDVSVGATLGLSAAVAATLVRDGTPVILVFLAALAVGLAAGLINGIGVVVFRVPAIVMTLGTMGIMRGLMFIYTNGHWVENLPDFFKTAAQAKIGFINIFVLIAIILILLIQLYLSKVKSGKYFAAVGDNINGANLVGIPVPRTLITAFIFSGVFSSIAGLVYTSQVGFVGNVAGSGTEMIAIASCVLGGVSLNGGIGSVVGAALGAVIMNSINTALVFLKVPSYWNDTISGTLLILIVVSDALIHSYLSEKTRVQRLSAKISNRKGA